MPTADVAGYKFYERLVSFGMIFLISPWFLDIFLEVSCEERFLIYAERGWEAATRESASASPANPSTLLSHKVLLNGSSKSTPPQNRQFIVPISNSRQ